MLDKSLYTNVYISAHICTLMYIFGMKCTGMRNRHQKCQNGRQAGIPVAKFLKNFGTFLKRSIFQQTFAYILPPFYYTQNPVQIFYYKQTKYFSNKLMVYYKLSPIFNPSTINYLYSTRVYSSVAR